MQRVRPPVCPLVNVLADNVPACLMYVFAVVSADLVPPRGSPEGAMLDDQLAEEKPCGKTDSESSGEGAVPRAVGSCRGGVVVHGQDASRFHNWRRIHRRDGQ